MHSIMMLYKFLVKLFLKTLKSQRCNAMVAFSIKQKYKLFLLRFGKSAFQLTRNIISLLALLFLYKYELI